MDKNKIALQIYSVEGDAKKDLFTTLKQVKEFGYSGVEFAGLYDHGPLELKEMCRELDLVTLSAHVPLVQLMENMEATIDCYQTLGCKYIVIPSLPEEYRPGNAGFQKVLDFLPTLGAAVSKRGMVLQYHNHSFEFVKLNGQYALDVLYATVGADKLQTQLDTCWVNVGGQDPVDYLKKYTGRIPTVHLKDFAGVKGNTKDPFEFRAVGNGVQDFPAIIAAADAGGAEWYIVEQDQPSQGYTPMECAKISAQYLLSLA